MSRIERGTVAVLLVDFLAAVGVITAGLLYAKVSPVYLVVLAAITFALFFIVWALLSRSVRAATRLDSSSHSSDRRARPGQR